MNTKVEFPPQKTTKYLLKNYAHALNKLSVIDNFKLK